MLHDPFFWAFIAVALILGWVYGRFRTIIKPLYETIAWQKRRIAELEREGGNAS